MTLRILAPKAFQPAVAALADAFSRRSGTVVDLTFGPAAGADPGTIESRLEAGEDLQLVLLPAAMTDRQVALGRLCADARVDAMRSMLALCVRTGSTRPDISTVDALRGTLQDAPSIGLSQAGSGSFVRDVLLDRLGLVETVMPRCRTILGEPVGAAVAKGEVDLGIQQLSELLQEDGIDIVGPLPEAAQGYTVIAATTLAGRPVTAEQAAFLQFLRSDEASGILRTAGLEPAPG